MGVTGSRGVLLLGAFLPRLGPPNPGGPSFLRLNCRPGNHPRVSQSSEIALCTKLELERILVLELVERDRFRRSCSEDRAARHFLVEVSPHHFGRERQVLDGSPAGDHAELRDVEVGIASVVAGRVADRGLTQMAGGEAAQ